MLRRAAQTAERLGLTERRQQSRSLGPLVLDVQRPAQVCDGVAGRAERHRRARRRLELFEHPRLAEIAGEQDLRRDLLGGRVVLVQQSRGLGVVDHPLGGEHALIDRGADDRVREREPGLIAEQIGDAHRGRGLDRGAVRHAGERRGVGQARSVTQDRHCTGQHRRGRRQATEPSHHRVGDPLRSQRADLGRVRGQRRDAGLVELVNQLSQQKRVPGGGLDDRPGRSPPPRRCPSARRASARRPSRSSPVV